MVVLIGTLDRILEKLKDGNLMIEATVIISAILSVLGGLADQIIKDVKDQKMISIDQAQRLITRSLNLAYNKANRKGEQLTNRLMSIGLIQRTPALMKAVDRMYDQTKKEQEILSDDIAELNILEAEANDAYSQAADSSIFRKKSTMNRQQEVNENVLQKIKDIEKKL